MALTLVTSDLIHGLDYSKLTGTIPTWNQNTTGNAATATLAAGATILATARNIGGVSFNGSAAINLPGVNTAGNQPTSGNAGTVTNGVYTVGNQTIGGIKTFSGEVIINPSTNRKISFKDNNNAFKAGIQAVNTAGQMAGTSEVDELIIRSQLGMRFATGGNTERFRITSSGAATFSSSVTSSGLTVNTGNGAGKKIYLNGNTSRRNWMIAAQQNVDDAFEITRSTANGGSTYNSPSFLIQGSTGNVGIGETNPASKLEVNGVFGNPLTTGSAQNGIARFSQTLGNGVLDVGFGDNSGGFSWLQSRDSTNYATVYSLLLQPNGGNVGIGTTSPTQSKLVISPNVAASALDGLTLSYHPDATAAQVRTKLFIDSYHGKLQLTNGSGVVTTHISAGGTDTYFNGGNVGIGTTPSGYSTNGYVLRLHGGTQTYMAFNNTTHTNQVVGGFVIGNDASSANIIQREDQPIRFYTNNALRLTISSGGAATFANTVSCTQLTASVAVSVESVGTNTVAGGGYYRYLNTFNSYQILKQISSNTDEDTWAYRGSWNKIGTLNASTGVYTALSDINKKKDFEESTIGLSAIIGLKPTLYRMKDDESEGKKELGFIAQEVKEFIPQAYVENGDDDYQFVGLNYNAIVTTLTKAIQEQQAQIELLKQEVELLKQ